MLPTLRTQSGILNSLVHTGGSAGTAGMADLTGRSMGSWLGKRLARNEITLKRGPEEVPYHRQQGKDELQDVGFHKGNDEHAPDKNGHDGENEEAHPPLLKGPESHPPPPWHG